VSAYSSFTNLHPLRIPAPEISKEPGKDSSFSQDPILEDKGLRATVFLI
jgi:hypothetical protein